MDAKFQNFPQRKRLSLLKSLVVLLQNWPLLFLRIVKKKILMTMKKVLAMEGKPYIMKVYLTLKVQKSGQQITDKVSKP